MRRWRAPRNHPRAGFSLLELMLVLAILGVVSATVGKTFLDFSRAFSSIAKLTHATSRAQTIMDRLVAEIITGRFISLNPPTPLQSNSLEFQKIVGFAAGAPVYGNPFHIEAVALESNPTDGV